MLGSNLGNGNLAAVTKANYLCNQLGLDTISVGGTIACAMEMFEKGYITKEDTGGIELKFGNENRIPYYGKLKGLGIEAYSVVPPLGQ